MDFTVLDALATEGFWGATVLTGWSGLRLEVRGITVAEVPDSAGWLEGGEIVLTTGYIFRDQPQEFAVWMESLVEGGAVAVAVKRRRFLGDVPREVITLAEAKKVPLIALRHRVAWPGIIGPVLRRQHASSGRYHPPTSRDALHRILEGKQGFPTVARALAQLWGWPVLLQGPSLELQAVGIPENGHQRPPQHWESLLKYRSSVGVIRQLRKELAQHRRERVTAPWKLDGHCVSWRMSAGSDREPEEDVDDVDSNPSTVEEHFFPLVNDDQDVGYLSILHGRSTLEASELRDYQYAAAIVSLGFQRLLLAGERHLSPYATALLRALKANEDFDMPGAVSDALQHKGAIAAVRPSWGRRSTERPRPGLSQRGVVDNLLRDLESWHRSRDRYGLLTYEGDVFYFLLTNDAGAPHREEHENHHPRAQQQRWLKALREFVAELYGVTELSAGFSESGEGRPFYVQAFSQSRHSLGLASDPSFGESQAVWYEDLGIFRLLVGTGSLESIQSFCDRYLGPLGDAGEGGTEGDPDLIKTLRAFFVCDGNLTEAAAQLYLHRNTMRYRLNRIRDLTGLDVFTSEGHATLYLALRLQYMLSTPELLGVNEED